PLTSVELLQAIELVEREAAERAAGQCRGTSTTRLGPKDRPAEEKLLILKAKTILMDNLAMTESQAHRFLQKTSMDRGLRLTDAARMVIENSLTP
ncbi:MAG TPA: ANTAR domain-containing protein, partial [Treponemataceae bacterium]|nr:ANTAR domain-containing protein [Treponemataceae bacterium]